MSTAYSREKEFIFTWKIHNYSTCCYDTGEKFKSPNFTAESLYQSRWYLCLYPKGISSDYKEYISLFLCRDDDNTVLYKNGKNIDCAEFNAIFLNFKLEVLDPQGDLLQSWQSDDSVFNRANVKGCNTFMLNNQLIDKFADWVEDILIIRCHMKVEPKLRLNNQCEIQTKINVIRSCYKWQVNKIVSSDCFENITLCLFDSSNFEITLNSIEDNLKIKINKKDTRSLPSKLVTCKISLLNNEGKKSRIKIDAHYFGQNSIWEFPDFITKNELENETNKFFKNGMFTLAFEFACSNGVIPISIEEYSYSSLDIFSCDDTVSALQKDFRNMFNDEKYCDIKLRADNEIVPAHKAILAARSPIFSIMFDQDMLENKTGIVDIPDLDKKSLKLFWEFLYTGKLNTADTETTLTLFIVADRFQIISLKEKCFLLIIETLSDKNVCKIFKVADMLEHHALKECALNFILNNTWSILPSPEWSEWIEANSKLATEVLSKISVFFGGRSNRTLGNAAQLMYVTSLNTTKEDASVIDSKSKNISSISTLGHSSICSFGGGSSRTTSFAFGAAPSVSSSGFYFGTS